MLAVILLYRQYQKVFTPNCDGGCLWEFELAWKKGWTRAGRDICFVYCVHVCSVTQSCLTHCSPVNCSLPGSSVRGIFQASIKSGPENRGRSARGTTHVASLEFPRETGLILRCAGKIGNPFQTKQGNRLSCRDQEGRRSSNEVVPGTSVFPSSETGISGNFWGRIKGAKYRFARKDVTWDFS